MDPVTIALIMAGVQGLSSYMSARSKKKAEDKYSARMESGEVQQKALYNAYAPWLTTQGESVPGGVDTRISKHNLQPGGDFMENPEDMMAKIRKMMEGGAFGRGFQPGPGPGR